MCAHHLLKTSDLEFICPYCKTELHENKWNSEFHVSKHYKFTECKKCNKKVSVKVNFQGSGHDSWRKEKNMSKINTKEKLEDYDKQKKSLEKLIA